MRPIGCGRRPTAAVQVRYAGKRFQRLGRHFARESATATIEIDERYLQSIFVIKRDAHETALRLFSRALRNPGRARPQDQRARAIRGDHSG